MPLYLATGNPGSPREELLCPPPAPHPMASGWAKVLWSHYEELAQAALQCCLKRPSPMKVMCDLKIKKVKKKVKKTKTKRVCYVN